MSHPTSPSFVGTVTFDVVGMTCDHCRRAVTEEITRIPAVDDVVVDLAGGTVSITAREPVTHADVAAAVDEAGYTLGDPR